MPIYKHRIILTEEIEQLSEDRPAYLINALPDNCDALDLLQSVLLPGELLKLARRLAQARDGGGFVTVGVQFERGHPRKIVYSESETLERS